MAKKKTIKAFGKEFSQKDIVTSVLGGALLLYAYKNKSSKLGRLASLAGTSLLGRGIGGTAGVFS